MPLLARKSLGSIITAPPSRQIRVLSPPRRCLHLAPPFLLDDPYVPRYQTLSATSITQKKDLAHTHLQKCNLCPRLCGTNRYETTGYCLIPAQTVKVSTIAPHFGEEPCIQGHHGSGSVFFSGCNLRCVFCQNHDIAHQRSGFDLTPEQLAEWYLKLQDVGRVHNINLVTPEHVVPQVVLSILHARDLGLKLPVVYNTSAFDSRESLELLDGVVDIYMPDFKVWTKERSKRLLKADDYASAARESLKLMWDQVGDLCFTGDGIAKKGVLVRHLVMPGMEGEGKSIMSWLGSEISKDLFVNLMEQYCPDAHVGKLARAGANVDGQAALPPRYQDINRAVTEEEVSSVKGAAEAAGIWRFCDPPRHTGFSL